MELKKKYVEGYFKCPKCGRNDLTNEFKLWQKDYIKNEEKWIFINKNIPCEHCQDNEKKGVCEINPYHNKKLMEGDEGYCPQRNYLPGNYKISLKCWNETGGKTVKEWNKDEHWECNYCAYKPKSFTEFIPYYKNLIQSNNSESTINKKQNNNELEKKINEEKNKNKNLIEENNNLKQKLEELNNKIKNINKLEEKIKSLENQIKNQNTELQKYKENNGNQTEDIFSSLKPGEKILAINFVSKDCQDITHYNQICKNTELFVRIEERLYKDFPQFKDYETVFEVNGKRIKRFKTLDENKIRTNDVIYVIRNK